MNSKIKPAIPWPLVWYLGIASILSACSVGVGTAAPTGTAPAPATPTPTGTPSLHLDNGAIEVQDQNKDWVPIGGGTTFELVGELQSTDPWMVSHNTFATRDFTQIADGLKVDDPVRVKGVILEDATWLAETIEPAGAQTEPAITLVGRVDSVDPWVVSGIKLDVTDDTVIAGKIAPEMIVRVAILLREDGTWEITRIVSLSSFTEIPGCTTISATVTRVKGKEVQFAGWPPITLTEDTKVETEAGTQATLSANRMVLVVACPTDNGRFTITKIIVLRTSGGASVREDRALVCHKPDKQAGHTLSIPAAALPAHLRHGDKLGRCL